MAGWVPRVAAVAALALAGCGQGSDRDVAGASAPHNTRLDVAYVGEDGCRRCHAEVASTHAHTGMGRSWDRMRAEIVVEDFERHNELELPDGLRYRMLVRDGRYFQRQFVLDEQGRETAVDEREIVWAIGSNNHSRAYASEIDGKLFQMPVCWYPGASRWDLCPGYEMKNELFAREISISCAFCHNGRMERVEGERNAFRAVPTGIDCERCHGPGELHVARWRGSDEVPTGGADPTIVNPRRLPRERRIEVCLQCHMGDSKAAERVVRHGRRLEDHRPGLPLVDTVQAFAYREALPAEFGLSAQGDRFVLSACYQKSGGRLECLTCHNPHVSAYAKDRPADLYREACLGCHEPSACTAPASARQATAPLADDCVRCHMRRAEPDDQRYTEFTDHWIRRDIAALEPRRRSRYELVPLLPAEHARLDPGEQAFQLAHASLLISQTMPAPTNRIPMADAERGFREALRLGVDRAETWFFLGKALLGLRRGHEAIDAFRSAHQRDPAHEDAAFALGQGLAAMGDVEGAIRTFERIVDANPRNAGAIAELARCHLQLGRGEKALALYDRAAALEPWKAILHANRGTVLAALGRMDEALQAAAAATRLDPVSPGMWELYAGVLEAAGRPAEAASARARIPRGVAPEVARAGM